MQTLPLMAIASSRKRHNGNLEDAIVRELSTRTPTTRVDQFKIDYCLLTHTNESAMHGFNS